MTIGHVGACGRITRATDGEAVPFYRGAMRMSSSLAVLALLVVFLPGCQLRNDSNNCVGEPGEAGGGVSVCTEPPPTQFDQLGK
jgi:hypothetical protein